MKTARLAIRHETVYRYTAPLSYTIQQLRMSPRIEPHQRVSSWTIGTGNGGRLRRFTDAFGNISHMLTITHPHDEVGIVAEGTVEVSALDRGRLTSREPFSPLVFTVPTRLTTPDEQIRDFAARHLGGGRNAARMLTLAEAIRDNIAYQPGATGVNTAASDALQLGRGVCQDHAHLFLACCHAQGIPARYVSGYIDPGDTTHAASHAWVDAWIDDVDHSGWISIDVTHARHADQSHCRLAVGRDYDSAAPVRGMRHGGGAESMLVSVQVGSSPD